MASFRKRGPYQWQAQVRKKAALVHPWTSRHWDILSGRPLSSIPGLQGIGTSCPAGHPLQTRTFETRAEAESTTLKELLERYLEEVTPLQKGTEPETNRLRLRRAIPSPTDLSLESAAWTSPAGATSACAR